MHDEEEKIVSLAQMRAKSEKSGEPREERKSGGQKDFEPVYCSFCGRPNTQVIKMVQGPGVNICSECTMIAVQYLILEDKILSHEAQSILDSFWHKV
ncbi:MAG: ClpX C4-type zinc finger protein [Candidatus Gastranaerophilaceae bacterium]